MVTGGLAAAELAIMTLLWEQGAMTARQLQERLYGASDRSQHGTVQRLLQRLLDKGFVQRERARSAALWPNPFHSGVFKS